jgi:hypothetical protein
MDLARVVSTWLIASLCRSDQQIYPILSNICHTANSSLVSNGLGACSYFKSAPTTTDLIDLSYKFSPPIINNQHFHTNTTQIKNLRSSLRFRQSRLNSLDILRPKPRSSPLMLGTCESRTHRPSKVRQGSGSRRPPISKRHRGASFETWFWICGGRHGCLRENVIDKDERREWGGGICNGL